MIEYDHQAFQVLELSKVPIGFPNGKSKLYKDGVNRTDPKITGQNAFKKMVQLRVVKWTENQIAIMLRLRPTLRKMNCVSCEIAIPLS